jgi:hypothetical protein
MKFPFPIAEITCAEVVPMCSLCLFPASVRSSVQKWDLHSLSQSACYPKIDPVYDFTHQATLREREK